MSSAKAPPRIVRRPWYNVRFGRPKEMRAVEPAISQMAKQEPGLSDTSYALVFAKLPKRVQREIAGR